MNVTKESLLLYAVTDRYWLGDRTLKSVVEEALQGGVTFLQLREKKLDGEHFLQEAKELQALCRKYNVPFIVNDNVDVALAMGADGVHVGQHDMEAGGVRKLLGPDKILGVSAQTVEQALLAQANGADYLGVGAVCFLQVPRMTRTTSALRLSRRSAMQWTSRSWRSAGSRRIT